MKTAVLQRAGVIYRWHLAAYTIAFAVLGFDALISGRVSLTSPELFWHHPARSMLLGPLLLYQPGLLDILPIYCLFVLLLPTVLAALEQGQRWKVLAVSCGVWSCAQFAPTFDGAHLLAPFNFGALNPLAWQFLFVGGVVIGHARVDAPATMVPGRTGLLAAALVGAVFFFALQHGFISPPWPNPEFGVMLNKPSLGFLRLASFALVAYLVAVVAARFPRLLTSRLLALIGRHSLPLVAVHCVLVLLLLAHSELFATATGRWGVMIFVLCVLVAIAGVCEHVKIPIAPRAPVGSFPFPLRGGLGERSAAVQR